MTGSDHLDVPSGGRCAFCDYLSGARPYTVLRRVGVVATLVTREQRGIAHVLVLPVRHCPTILDVSVEESGELMHEVVAAARAIDAAEQRPGIAIWQNNGSAADQTIPHVHFHVAGTLPGGGTARGLVKELSVAQTDEIATKLRPHLPDL